MAAILNFLTVIKKIIEIVGTSPTGVKIVFGMVINYRRCDAKMGRDKKGRREGKREIEVGSRSKRTSL